MTERINLWQIRKLPVFILLCLSSGLLTFLWNEVVIYDDLYYDFFANQMSFERVTGFLNKADNLKWVTYCSIPIIYIFKILLVTAILLAGLLIFDYRVTFRKIIQVVLISEFVFLIPFTIRILWFYWIDNTYDLNDLQKFYPLSIINLMDSTSIASWLVYPFQILNVFELLHWLILAFGLMKVSEYKYSDMFKTILVSYIPALFLWVVIVMFLSINYQ